MVKELLIMRHGHANDFPPSGQGGGDFARELRDKGKRNAQRVGVWLARNDLHPDHVISSPAIRALRTAEKTCKTSGLNSDIVITDKRIYEAKVEDLLEIIKSIPKATKRLMLVGHNPGFEALIEKLCREKVKRTKSGSILPAAALAHIELDCDWGNIAKNSGTCQQIIRPKKLPRQFPFPGLEDKEDRCRPAYYYSQSSVVPYRIEAGNLEVLIVASSKQKHWVIPKGIHDPGISAQASAANEAFEEAGVLGDVAEKMIGTYSYPKWDATCTVSVYPMKVTRVLPEEEWEESHRGRRWVSVEEAAGAVLNADVQKMVLKLPGALKFSDDTEGS
ncbi:MAG: histidine phosphatase family protein [Rhodospirillales bacterium]|nr:histidine phosphatase family protein [Rhodospirillales bacterium]